MAKTLIWAVALIVSAMLLANGGINAQRVMLPPEEPAPAPAPEESTATPVMVENFPAAQVVDVRGFPLVVTVEGTVDVGNFPTMQNVAGTVDVGNLPLDADGNLRVSSSGSPTPKRVRFIGYTAELPHTFAIPMSLALGNSECDASFSGSRMCVWEEFILQIPPVAIDQNQPCVLTAYRHGSSSAGSPVSRLRLTDLLTGTDDTCPSNSASTSFPLACCGL